MKCAGHLEHDGLDPRLQRLRKEGPAQNGTRQALRQILAMEASARPSSRNICNCWLLTIWSRRTLLRRPASNGRSRCYDRGDMNRRFMRPCKGRAKKGELAPWELGPLQ